MDNPIASLSEYLGYILAFLAVWILLRCARALLTRRGVPAMGGALELPGKDRREVCAAGCLIGRAGSSDVALTDPSVKSTHALLRRGADGIWVLTDLSRGETFVGGKAVEGEALLKSGDRLRFGKVSARFSAGGAPKDKPSGARRGRDGATLLLLSLFDFCLLLAHFAAAAAEYRGGIALGFGTLIAAGWGLYFAARRAQEEDFACPTIALLLTAVGFSVAASSTPEAMGKQTALFAAGAALYTALGFVLRREERVIALRWVVGGLGLAGLALTLLTSQSVMGAKNWLSVAGASLQPSEFVKLAFVCVGGAPIEKTLSRRQALPFLAFAAVCVGTLALMGDFGTALVFFAAYLVMIYLRTGSLALEALSLGAAGTAVAVALSARPYVAARFANWGRAWADPLGAGYQQVRCMSALASGGLFGRGAHRGWLHKVVAADTDLVFGVVGEELGLIAAVCCLLAVLLLPVYVRRAAGSGSGYYAVAAAGAVTMFLFQVGLNVFGSLDLVPFTGVTFPFVSRGGSSLIACWGLLAFVRAAAAPPIFSGAPAAKKPAAAKKAPAAKKPAAEKKPTAAKKPAAAKKPSAPKKTGGKKEAGR